MLLSRSIILVFLPFAAGYYLSCFFRTINALISQQLISDLALNSADLGFLTSVFFLSFAIVQLPLGFCLDRYGPRRVQFTVLPLAAAGALLFSAADGFLALALGRAFIGVGVAAALMAGLKAIVLWFPQDRVLLANGCFVTIGALGAVSATVPAELLLVSIGWRGLFEALAAATAVCAITIYLIVPHVEPSIPPVQAARSISFKSIYADPRFWRLAPLSATCVGTSWALQGLWAASWLSDVEGLEHSVIVQHLFVMAIALCLGALFLGIGADQLRRRVSPRALLATIAILVITAQLSLILRLPVPSYLLWAIVAGVGAATVLSFAILGEDFPREIAGQANAALNVIHVTTAFALQSAVGVVIHQWPSLEGHYPLTAYQTAFAVNVAIQIAALAWFMCPARPACRSALTPRDMQLLRFELTATHRADLPYVKAAQNSNQRLAIAHASARKWRLVAVGSAFVSATIAAILVTTPGCTNAISCTTKIDRRSAPSDPEIAYLLDRFVRNIRSLSTDAIVVRSSWLEAFDFVTDRAARALTEEIRSTNPFSNIGTRPVIAQITSVQRVFGNTFEIRWNEQSYAKDRLIVTEHFIGRITAILETVQNGARQTNPFGLRIDAFEWSREVRGPSEAADRKFQ